MPLASDLKIRLGDTALSKIYLGTSVLWSAGTTPVTPGTPSMARLTKTSAGMIQANGVNFRTGGINAFQLITNDYPQARLMTKANIDSLLSKAKSLNVGIIRAHTLAAGVQNDYVLVKGTQGDGTDVKIIYDDNAWDRIDYAAYKAGQMGIYLIAPFVDELGYYHGGKRNWVNFRHPGSVSLDYAVKAANSAAQRQAENVFYTDPQIKIDFRTFIKDWLTHVNPYNGLRHMDDPVFSIVQIGNELWTAAEDAPGWVADLAAYIKSVSPNTLVMDSGTDGLAIEKMAWDSPNIDILETHPYTEFTAENVRQQSVFAAAQGKAYMVGEYAWSKDTAPGLEQVVRNQGNIFSSALWSLQNDEDLHNDGAPYGGDDASFYYPGKDATQQSAVARIQTHHKWLIDNAATSTPPAVPTQGADSYSGADNSAWNPDLWRIDVPRAASGQADFGNSAILVSNRGRLHVAALGGYDGNAYVIASSRAPAVADAVAVFDLLPAVVTREAYFRAAIRSKVFGVAIARTTCYFLQIGANTDGTAYLNIGKMVSGAETFAPGGGVAIPGWGGGSPVTIRLSAVGSTIQAAMGSGTVLKTMTDSSITGTGYTGFDLRGGNAAVAVDWDIDNWHLDPISGA